MKLLEHSNLTELFRKAAADERLRSHLNLHDSYDDKVQRLLIAMVKGSFVEPHFHKEQHQWEMFTVLEGVVELTIYSAKGELLSQHNLGCENAASIAELSPGDIHSVRCISEQALLLEVKEGPFDPRTAKSFVQF